MKLTVAIKRTTAITTTVQFIWVPVMTGRKGGKRKKIEVTTPKVRPTVLTRTLANSNVRAARDS